MKLLVAISVSRDWVETEFLLQMGRWRVPIEWEQKFGWFKQFTAQERHNVAINEALFNYDRVIFMDTDQMYPPEYIEMMLAHKEPVVSALNVSRYYPFECSSHTITGEEEYEGITIPTHVNMKPPSDKPVFECDMVGTGALMVNPVVLKELKLPYFKDIYDKEGARRLLPDDFYFSWQLHKAGIKITVDQNIIVKHMTRLLVSPYNTTELNRAWDKVNSGFGIMKDGKQAL